MLWWFAQTSLIAGALAVVATLAGRWKRLGPESRHALWLLVLIKLAIPPFVAWPWSLPDAWPARLEPGPVAVQVPAPAALPALPVDPVKIPPPDALPSPTPSLDPPKVAGTPPSPEEVLAGVEITGEAPAPNSPDPGPVETGDPTPAPQAQESKITNPSIWNWESALLAAWLAGSVVVVARRGFKVFRFHRGLADARPAPDWLVDEARAIGERVGVRPPPVVATPRVATPLLWCLGRPRLILPEALIKRLGVDRWPGILAHELAHLARGDHWVVRLELLVEAAWWWNPLFWIARRRLHEQAEIACDARVVRALPGRRHAYAEALVDVCEHIARSAIPSPSLGVGGPRATHSLEGRLHMILRDPIPRRPGRRATILAALLAALAMPAWTLGQQPEAPSAKPDAPTSPGPEAPPSGPKAPPAAPTAPEMPPQAAPAPATSSVTIEAIVAAQAKAREGLGNLSFRYVVASRDQSHSLVRPPGAGGVMVANNGGGRGGAGMSSMAGGGMGGMGQPAGPMQRVKTVHVQVADVVLDLNGHSRLDVIEAGRAPEGTPPPGDQARHLAWDRRFVAFNGEGYLALEMAWDKTGPVPFRWLGANNQQASFGDSLIATLYGNSTTTSIILGRGINPLAPNPRNVLDLFGVTLPFLATNTAHAEVVGLETIDGREVVRVAWIANADIGLRGLCWLAPDLGYAVVRSDASQDPNQFGRGRRSWRRRSSDFAKVANLWLPRKVTYEEAEFDPAGGEPARRVEREMTFEDYRADPTLPADTFRPKLAVQALDDLTGNFTAQPPGLPPGLYERLVQAVRESKFGPPVAERTVEEPKADATQSATPGKPVEKPSGKPDGQQATKPARPDDPPAPVDDLAKADPKMIARPAPGLEDPIPTIGTKIDDPISPKPPADRAEADRAIERRFKLDPEVIDLARQMTQASKKVDEVKRAVHNDPNDPALKVAQGRLDGLKAKYEQLWEEKSRMFRAELGPDLDRIRDEIEVLQARRDGKAAEVRKAEAQRDAAVVERDNTVKIRAKNGVSAAEVALYEAKLKGAEAEVAGKEAELTEADALLNQAKRRLGVATAAKPAPDPLADKAPRPDLAEGSKDADRDVDALDARDEVALRQARRDGKASEVFKAEAKRLLASTVVARQARLKAKGAGMVSDEEVARAEAELGVAKAELAGKQAELAEADVLLNRARRRLSGRPAASPESSPGDRPATLAELRDAVELMEVQIQGKQAELRGAEAKSDSAKTILEIRKPLVADGRITQALGLEAQTNSKIAQAELDAKKAEVLESETRLKQARRRLDATEARLRREVERAKSRLDWSEGMFKKGYVSKATYDADKAVLDDLMIQLDPKYVPAPPVAAPPPGDQSHKEDAGPKLSVKLAGEEARASGQGIGYKLSVSNPSTNAAKDVKVITSLPQQGGKLDALPPGAKFDRATHKLTWSIPQLEPLQLVEMSFLYATTTPGPYRATAEATSGDLRAADTLTTDVSGIAKLDVKVTQADRAVVGKAHSYDITIKNQGTADGTRLQLRGYLSTNIKPLKLHGVEAGEIQFDPKSGKFAFPEVDRLRAGETIKLVLEVQVVQPGPVNYLILPTHAELGAPGAKVEDAISAFIEDAISSIFNGGASGESAPEPQVTQGRPVDRFTVFVGAFW